jgi:hypothetical protein
LSLIRQGHTVIDDVDNFKVMRQQLPVVDQAWKRG